MLDAKLEKSALNFAYIGSDDFSAACGVGTGHYAQFETMGEFSVECATIPYASDESWRANTLHSFLCI